MSKENTRSHRGPERSTDGTAIGGDGRQVDEVRRLGNDRKD